MIVLLTYIFFIIFINILHITQYLLLVTILEFKRFW